MLKKVGIQVAGSGNDVRKGFVVTPDTTSQELLVRAKLPEFQLCPSSDDLPFGPNETIYERVGANAVLFAYHEAQAGHTSSML